MALLTLATPDHVNTVTGNPVANAIRKVLALQLDGKVKNANGSHAVAGNGPMNRSTGCTQ
jgi:hypothetical protein